MLAGSGMRSPGFGHSCQGSGPQLMRESVAEKVWLVLAEAHVDNLPRALAALFMLRQENQANSVIYLL